METIFVIVFFIAIVVAVIWINRAIQKREKDPSVGKFMCQLLHRVGIDGFPSGQPVVIWGYIDKLEIGYTKNKKNQKLIIDTKDITNISTFYEWQEKGNTQIKNAIIGGIIAGGAGAIVGSNLKNVKNKEYKFLSIKYLNEEKNEKILVFNGWSMSDNWINTFINDYKKYVANAADVITEIE